jgi:CDP-6-deoxy-D-xylo-4-hexulose-3-dehydrase
MWKMMSDNAISLTDRIVMADFICSSPKLSQGEMVKKFEREWSEWQGCKYSVFVNSGSSANLLAVSAMIEQYGHGRPWYAQSCTWSTNVAPILQLNGNKVGLCDADLSNFGPDLKTLETLIKGDPQHPRFFFLTHLLGFSGISDDLISLCEENNVTIIEDCCEATGTTFKGKKVGNFGKCSTFSFFYGHHMTTIEGGMVCTNDEETYEFLLLLRSHGLLRELPKESQKRKIEQVPVVYPQFTFMCSGFNVRNMEMNAVLGSMQLKNIDKHIEIRNKNYHTLMENLDPDLYKTNFNTEGISSFCLPIYTKKVDINKVEKLLLSNEIEYRPCVAGNLIKHPMFKRIKHNMIHHSFSMNSDLIHNNCIYVGNHQDVSTDNVLELCTLLNGV